MYAFLLQDWVTIRSASGSAITQGEASWLDLSAFLDIVLFLETKNFAISAGNLMMAFQTSPTKDDVLFQSMNDVSNTGTPVAVGVQTFVLLRDTALCPLAHWTRWQLGPPTTNPSGATSFEATFRIWASANQPGGLARSSSMSSQMGYGDSGGFGGPAWTNGPAVSGSPSPIQPPPPSKTQERQRNLQLGLTQKPSTFTQGPGNQPKASPDAPGPGPENDLPPYGHRLPRDRSRVPVNVAPYLSPGTTITRK